VRDPTNSYFIPDPAMNYDNLTPGLGGADENGIGMTIYQQVEKQCFDQKMGTGAYICKVGVKGYTGSGACTDNNGVAFTGSLGCFCGTVQVDTGTGHQSYSSTCGCDQNVNESSHNVCNTTTKACEQVSGAGTDTCTTDADCLTTTPTMACTGLAQAPAAPAIGDKVTFTCSGTITPANAGTLSYKFRYSVGTGAVTALANKTATTAELTIAACGDYKVECQTCATISGVLKCDPTWIGATQ
jgi:hypothetical protein